MSKYKFFKFKSEFKLLSSSEVKRLGYILTASISAFVFRSKPVTVSPTSTVYEFLARLCCRVIIVTWHISLA